MSSQIPKLPGFSEKQWTSGWIIALELVLALLGGLLLSALGLSGGAWILGGVLGGAIAFYGYHALSQNSIKPHRNVRKSGQIFMGLTIGFSIQQEALALVSRQLPVFMLIALFLLTSGALIGWVYSRLEKVDLLTATLATVPGSIGVMASIAADYDKNTALVSLVQLIRFTTIILGVPWLAHVPYIHDFQATLDALVAHWTLDPLYWLTLVGMVMTAIAAAVVGGRLKIPVAAFFCPIVVGIGFAWASVQMPSLFPPGFSLPPLLKIVGQMLLGTTIGEYWGINPHLRWGTGLRAGVPVLLTFAAGGAAAAIAKALTHADWLTCLLVSSPGGSPEMIAIALGLNHNVEVVTTGHVIRLITLNAALPMLVALVHSWDSRRAQAHPLPIQSESTVAETVKVTE